MQLRKKVITLLFILSSIQSLVWAQKGQTKANQSREAICKQVPCRPAKTIKLKVSKTGIAEFDFPKGPYVAEGYINILTGEELNVEFDEQENSPTNPRYVITVSVPERTITFKLEQTEEGTILTVKNPFAKTILYDCMIQHYKAQNFAKTSIMPVQGKLMNFEHWPDPLTQVVISNVRFVADKK